VIHAVTYNQRAGQHQRPADRNRTASAAVARVWAQSCAVARSNVARFANDDGGSTGGALLSREQAVKLPAQELRQGFLAQLQVFLRRV
jgi:hypothetical protein